MQSRINSFDVAVIGGGVIGLSIAWRAAQRGLHTIVLERGKPGAATSSVAAGMLAPVSEAVMTELPLLALGLASAHRNQGFVAELEDASGLGCGHLRCGTLLAARDVDDAEALERELALRTSLGLAARRLRASEARALEPAIAPTLRLALDIPDDHAIDPRRLTAALTAALLGAGVAVREGAAVTTVTIPGGRVAGVEVAGERVVAEHVVIAAGSWSASVNGVPSDALIPIHPVKGQILELRDPSGQALLSRVLRMRGGYVVPRGDGRYVVGATVEERGFDTTVTAGACFELLRDTIELLPGLSELVVERLSAGLRPATPDNLPAIGPGAISGLHWAAGHYRHGVLLAPVTAEIVVAGILGEDPSLLEGVEVAPFSPARFATIGAGV
ncbi:MAG TPA: glycine oxidase ThiO [Solirubrobacteraceae bacterium]